MIRDEDDGPPRTPIDLTTPADDVWRTVQPPGGWDGVAALARALGEQLDGLGERVVRDIEREMPGYVGVHAVPRADLHASVVRNLETLLIAVAQRQDPTAEMIAVRQELGRRRASQSVDARSVVRAYEIGFDRLWEELVARAAEADEATRLELLEVSPLVWHWLRDLTVAISRTFEQARFARDAEVVGARQRLTELLVGAESDETELAQLARTTGFDPAGAFQAVLVHSLAIEGNEPHRLQTALDQRPGVHSCVARGNRLVVITQDTDETVVVATVRELFTAASVGVGLRRVGLAGARMSVGDAELTVGFAGTAQTRRFHDMWLWAILGQASERLQDLVAVGSQVAAEHPHLADTVRAFSASGFSVSEAARRLDLHANTVSYRLERWHALTGWDPRTFPGLARSLASLVVGR